MNKKIIKAWSDFFDKKGLSNEVKNQYLLYINTLLLNKVPIIFDFRHLCLLLGRNNDYLSSVVNSPNNHYRHFKIRKRSGGFRDISTPYLSLLEIQYWILNNILKKILINSSAHGFAQRKSIITNSKIHTGHNELLKLDLKDFFPSIKLNRIIYVFKSVGYPTEIAFYLASICSYEGQLPQGAPTSPYLSNIVAKQLDKRLIHLAQYFDLNYTRYADDLTFSGECIANKFIDYVEEIIQEEGFEVNKNKTKLYKTKSKRIVTGISVLDKEIKLPNSYKRDLKQELYYIFRYSLESHIAKKKIRKANYLFSLIGKVNFWLSVEPKNEYAMMAKKKLIELYRHPTITSDMRSEV